MTLRLPQATSFFPGSAVLEATVPLWNNMLCGDNFC